MTGDDDGAGTAGESGDGDPDQGTTIHELDSTTVERIAAGEVVERPASVVKELVENSLDAGADRIDVTVDGDGTDLVRVRDDGHGMSEADVRAAVREHTTSKIGDVEDLESGVETLGFRGEALHTIGAVSRTTITTRRETDDRGTRLRYEGGEVTGVEPAGCPVGTTVEVEDLFFNTPARRKYLKREATEFAHVNRVVSRYALANPDVAVSLTHDDRETFATTGRGQLRPAILSVYGREVAEGMLPVAGSDPPAVATDLPDDGADLPAGPLSGIAGYASHPETTRSSAEYVSTFVNGRYVRSSTVRDAVVEAYGGQLASDRYPFAVLFLDLPAESVDVNVHPRKMEVRFGDEDGVRRQVRDAVRSALLDHGLVRSGAPRGRSAPDETPVAPGGSDDRSGGEASPDASVDGNRGGESGGQSGRSHRSATDDGPEGDRSTASAPREFDSPDGDTAETDATGGRSPGSGDAPPTDSGASSSGQAAGSGSTGAGRSPPTDRDSTDAAGTLRDADADRDRQSDAPGSGGDGTSTAGASGEAAGSAGSTSREGGATGGPDADASPSTDPDRKFDAATEQRTLAGDRATPETDYDRLPRMRVLGQFDDTYLVAETPSGLALVDQHAADERINYERLRAAFEGETTAQRLASPVAIELTAGERATFEAARDALADLGFEAELVDEEPTGNPDGADAHRHVLSVRAVPAVFDETVDPDELRRVLASFVEGDPGETVSELADRFLADLACYPSITGNTSLTEGSVTELLARLDDCENPYACPHGRPVVVRLDREEIEDRFERDYPGHG